MRPVRTGSKTGGPSQAQKDSQEKIAQTQTGIGTQYAGMAQNELQKMNTLQQPSIDFYQGIINGSNSGDYSRLIGAAGPVIGNISQQAQNTKDQIYNTVPAGAGRDYALAQLKQNSGNNISNTLNQLYTGALGQLAGLGQQAGQVGLNETGAALSGLSGGATTNQNLMNQEAQQKANTMGFFGSLAGAAGMAAGGGGFGKLFGGGGGGAGSTFQQLPRPATGGWLNAPTPDNGISAQLQDIIQANNQQFQSDMLAM